MLRRNLKSDFVGGAYVFPGGGVDDHDRHVDLEPICQRAHRRRGLGAARHRRRRPRLLGGGDPRVVRGGRRAAGLRRPTARSSDSTSPTSPPASSSTAARSTTGERRLVEICAEEGLQPRRRLDALLLPLDHPRGRAPPLRHPLLRGPGARSAQVPLHDDHEVIANLWVRPVRRPGPPPRRRVRDDLPHRSAPSRRSSASPRPTTCSRRRPPSARCRRSCPASSRTRVACASCCRETRATTTWSRPSLPTGVPLTALARTRSEPTPGGWTDASS